MIQMLMTAFFFDAVEVDGKIDFKTRGQSSVVTIPESELAAHVSGSGRPQELTTTRQQELELAATVEVSFVDPNILYQMNTQRARRLIKQSNEKMLIQLPINMTEDVARQIALIHLGLIWLNRVRHAVTVTLTYAYLTPTDVIIVQEGGLSYTCRIVTMEIRAGVIDLSLEEEDVEVYVSAATGAGQTGIVFQDGSEVTIPGPTRFFVMDFPRWGWFALNAPGVYVGAVGILDTWNGAVISRSDDFGVTRNVIGSNPVAATIGRATTVLADVTDPYVWDEGSTVKVTLLNSNTSLSSATKSAVLGGANYAILGAELIHFRTVVDNGGDNYTLSGLIRARNGTDNQTGSHAIGEQFMLLDNDTVTFPLTPLEDLARTIQYSAQSVGSETGFFALQSLLVGYISMKPLAPAHIKGVRNGSNDLTITWIRRSRYNLEWPNGDVDLPIGEAFERYRVDLYDSGFIVNTIYVTDAETTVYTASQQTTDGITPGDPVGVKISQISDTVGLGFDTGIILL